MLELTWWGDAVVLSKVVRMHIDEPWNDGLSGQVDGSIRARLVASADAGDSVVLDDDVAVLDDLSMIERDDAHTGEGQSSMRSIPGYLQVDLAAVGLARAYVIDEEVIGTAEGQRVGISPVREVAAFGTQCLGGERRLAAVDTHGNAAGTERRKWHQINIVAFLIRDRSPIRRHHRLTGGIEDHVHASIGAVRAH